MNTVALKVENLAPDYLRDNGGAQWRIETVSGAEASAIRDSRTSVWTFLLPDGTFTHESVLWTDADAIVHLKAIIRCSLLASLEQLNDESISDDVHELFS